jgi:hypothetical protein
MVWMGFQSAVNIFHQGSTFATISTNFSTVKFPQERKYLSVDLRHYPCTVLAVKGTVLRDDGRDETMEW